MLGGAVHLRSCGLAAERGDASPSFGRRVQIWCRERSALPAPAILINIVNIVRYCDPPSANEDRRRDRVLLDLSRPCLVSAPPWSGSLEEIQWRKKSIRQHKEAVQPSALQRGNSERRMSIPLSPSSAGRASSADTWCGLLPSVTAACASRCAVPTSSSICNGSADPDRFVPSGPMCAFPTWSRLRFATLRSSSIWLESCPSAESSGLTRCRARAQRQWPARRPELALS